MNNSLFEEILQRSKDNRELISIWSYDDNNKFWSGYVKNFTDSIITLRHFTKYGKPDGILVLNLEDIQRIDIDDDYSKAMQCVIDYASELDKEITIDYDVVHDEYWQYEVLKFIEGNRETIAKIEIEGEDEYAGFVLRVSDTDVLLHTIGDLGENQGSTIFKIDDITAIRVNDIESRRRLMLFKWRLAGL